MENKENNSPELKKKSHWNIRPYLAIALTAFLVITLSIIFFFLIYRYNGFAAGWRKLTVILQPIIIGIVIAYLINPIMMFFEKYLSHCHMTFQCLVIQRVKSVMNTVTDKKSVTLLSHRNG